MYHEEPGGDQSKVRLRSTERPRGSDPPPEPAIPPRKELDRRVAPYPDSPLAWERNLRHWSRLPAREERPVSSSKRSRSRAASRRRHGRERETRRQRSDSRREREPRRRRSQETDQKYVKVVVEKYEPRHKSERGQSPRASQQRWPPQKPAAEKRDKSSSKRQDRSKQRGQATAAATEDPGASSSEYTYEYESSTPEAVTAGKKATPAGKKPGNADSKDVQGKKNDQGQPVSSGKKAAQPAASQSGVSAQTHGGGADAAAASSAAAAGQHQDLMVALLKAAMETARR